MCFPFERKQRGMKHKLACDHIRNVKIHLVVSAIHTECQNTWRTPWLSQKLLFDTSSPFYPHQYHISGTGRFQQSEKQPRHAKMQRVRRQNSQQKAATVPQLLLQLQLFFICNSQVFKSLQFNFLLWGMSRPKRVSVLFCLIPSSARRYNF